MKNKKSNNTERLKYIKFPVIVFLIFLLYLISLPYFVRLKIPCLQFSPGASFQDVECRVIAALDTYIFLALSGFALVIFTQHLVQNPRSLKHTFIIAFVLAVSTIIAYHLYIPQAESAVRKAPIILEILPDIK